MTQFTIQSTLPIVAVLHQVYTKYEIFKYKPSLALNITHLLSCLFALTANLRTITFTNEMLCTTHHTYKTYLDERNKNKQNHEKWLEMAQPTPQKSTT